MVTKFRLKLQHVTTIMLPAFISSLFFTVILFSCFCLGCSDSPTASQDKSKILTQTWTGEEFFLITIGDSTFKGKDYVETFEFKKDESYFFYKFTMSSLGKVGSWKLENDDTRIKLKQDSSYSEIFPILVLNSASFIMGDTNLHWSKLIPKLQ